MGILSSIFGGAFRAAARRDVQKLRTVAERNPVVRQRMKEVLAEFSPMVEAAKARPEPIRRGELQQLSRLAQRWRHEALQAGARNEEDPEWAAAAVCESWMLALGMGSPQDVRAVEELVRWL